MSPFVPSRWKGVTHQFAGAIFRSATFLSEKRLATNSPGFEANPKVQTSKLVAFEFDDDPSADNLLIFVGGLTDGLLTVPYLSELSRSLPAGWTLAQTLLSSSYSGWGTASLKSDVKEISRCVAYFRTIKKGKVVVMGHSTGCQDVMEYLTGSGHKDRAPIDGAIIQASVSDREAISLIDKSDGFLERSISTALSMLEKGQGESIIPAEYSEKLFPGPVCARRWLSLCSPNHDGEDDYFSSDLTDEQLKKTFGALPAGTPLCILYSGNDEYVPPSIDKSEVVKRWIAISKEGAGKIDETQSGVISGATHNLKGNPPEVVGELCGRVVRFLSKL